MIPNRAIAAWRGRKPWRTDAQVAQDLLLSAVAIEIAKHPVTGRALLWRGGTCLHQLHLQEPGRYSEDLDYVLLAGTADYRQLDDAFAEIAGTVGAAPVRPEKGAERYKIHFADAFAGGRIEIKIEINTRDAAPRFDPITLDLTVEVPAWYVGSAAVPTYCAAELVGTKFRAIAEREKGRDLWDLDLARTRLRIGDDDLADAAAHYLAHRRISPAEFRQRLGAHLASHAFVTDVVPLLAAPDGYDPISVGQRVTLWTDRHLDCRLPNHEQRRSITAAGETIRCPSYELRDGTFARCAHETTDRRPCPQHPDTLVLTVW